MKPATSRSTVRSRWRHIIAGGVGSLIVLMAALAWPATASAQGRVLIGQRETISRLGPIADRDVAAQFGERLKVSEGFVEAAERARQGGLFASVGFKYSETLIGMPVWTSDGVYCVFLGRRHIVVSEADAAALLGINEADLQPPFFYRVPFGLIAYPVAVIVGVPVLLFLQKRNDAAKRRAHQAYLDSFQADANGETTARPGSVLLTNSRDRT